MTERFSEVAGAELHQTGGECSQTIPSRQVSFKISKSCPVSAQRPPIADRSLGINVLFCPLQFNRRHETEKPRPIFLTILGIHSVLRFGDAMGSAVFSEYVLKNKKDKSKNVSSV